MKMDGPPRVILGQSMSTCSACGGNAMPGEPTHLHGGPLSGWQPGCDLGSTNGCGVVFELPPLNPYSREEATP